ncbi:hypothetical protein BGW80DRAFT_1256483 [Lactifluus volemus]|nr:hypothetical protein BGW80DRAFT_1256483 [Lactifluus volemus]
MQLMFIQAHGSLAFTIESEKHQKLWTPFPIFAVLTTLVAPLFVTTSFDEDSQNFVNPQSGALDSERSTTNYHQVPDQDSPSSTFPIQGIYLLSLTIWEGAWYFTRRDRAQFEDEGCYVLCSR